MSLQKTKKMKFKDWFMFSLGALLAIGFFVILALLITVELPETNEKILYMAIGALVAKFSDVVGYFYGSSQGSSDKNDIISRKNA